MRQKKIKQKKRRKRNAQNKRCAFRYGPNTSFNTLEQGNLHRKLVESKPTHICNFGPHQKKKEALTSGNKAPVIIYASGGRPPSH
jgi:hypothetical protein